MTKGVPKGIWQRGTDKMAGCGGMAGGVADCLSHADSGKSIADCLSHADSGKSVADCLSHADSGKSIADCLSYADIVYTSSE